VGPDVWQPDDEVVDCEIDHDKGEGLLETLAHRHLDHHFSPSLLERAVPVADAHTTAAGLD
jgi:hypothetical protein